MKRPTTLARDHMNAAYKILRAEVRRRAVKILEGKNATREFVVGMGVSSFFDENGAVVDGKAYLEPIDDIMLEFSEALCLEGETMHLQVDESGIVIDLERGGG